MTLEYNNDNLLLEILNRLNTQGQEDWGSSLEKTPIPDTSSHVKTLELLT